MFLPRKNRIFRGILGRFVTKGQRLPLKKSTINFFGLTYTRCTSTCRRAWSRMSFAVTKVEEYEVPSAKWRSMPFAVCTSSSIAVFFKVFRTLVPHEDDGNCHNYGNHRVHTVRAQTIQCTCNCNRRQKHQAKQESKTCKVLHRGFRGYTPMA